MIQSRKSVSKIHANFSVSGVKRFFADRVPADAFAPAYAFAA